MTSISNNLSAMTGNSLKPMSKSHYIANLTSFKACADNTTARADEGSTGPSQIPENSEAKSVLKTVSEALKKLGKTVQSDIQEMFGNENNR